MQVQEGSELEGGLWALGTQISVPPWLCDPGHVSSPLWASMDWFQILTPLCTAIGRLAQMYRWGLGQSVVHSRRSIHRDLNCPCHGEGRLALHLEGRSARGKGGTGLAWQPRAQGHREGSAGDGESQEEGVGSACPWKSGLGWTEQSQGLGSHRGAGRRLGPGCGDGRQGGREEARTRVHSRESGLTSAGATGTQRGRGRESPGRGKGLMTDRTGVCEGRGAGREARLGVWPCDWVNLGCSGLGTWWRSRFGAQTG